MKKLIVFLLCLPAVLSFSQKASTWKGNCAGHAFDWDWAANWSTNAIPDEFTDVVIPFDYSSFFNYPQIKRGNVEINSLYMNPGTSLLANQFEIRILDMRKSYFTPDQIKHKIKFNDVREFISDQPLNAFR